MPQARELRRFTLKEFSGVDKPAQLPALAAIIKHAGGATTGDPLRKRTIDTIKRGDLVEFLTGSTDGHQHGISLHVWDGELHLVVHFAVSENAEMSHDHMVAFDGEGNPILSENDGHSHDLDAAQLQRIIMNMVMKTAEDDDVEKRKHSKDPKRRRLGRAVKAALDSLVGTDAERDTVIKQMARASGAKVETVKDLLEGFGNAEFDETRIRALAKVLEAPVDVLLKAANETPDPTQTGDDNVDKELQAELDAQKAENATLAKQVATLTAVATLSDVAKAHYESLDDAGKTEFLAKSEDERTVIIKALDDADPVVYTDSEGEVYRKSDGAREVKLAKRADEALKTANAEKASRELLELTKRVETEIPHLPGTVDQKIAMLKAIEAMPEADREPALAMLKASAPNFSTAYEQLGVTGGHTQVGSGSEAEQKLESMAKEMQKADKDLTYEVAYAKALETPEGGELYKSLRPVAATATH